MRMTMVVALLVSSLSANPYVDSDPANAETGVLVIWPTARSTALAGAMTGLADEADATYFNPAGLAFQKRPKAYITYARWLPGWRPGMCYASATGGAPLRVPSLQGHSTYVSGSLVYLTRGEEEIINERNELLGRVNVWRAAAGAHVGLVVTNTLGVGLGLKLVRSSYCNYDVWWDGSVVELRSSAWTPDMNTAITAAADVGLLYRPFSQLSIGAIVANLGPRVVYRPSGASDELPRTARLGLCWRAVESRDFRLRIMPELDKLLVSMFRDTTGRKPLGRKLEEEWKDARRALGIEATAFRLVSIRLGYFEDLTNQRGGIMLENRDGQTYHYGIWDALSRKSLGKLKSIGLCWGFGIGYKDYLRFDVSDDGAIYDWPTSNWKFSLVADDIAGGIRELR